MTRHQERLRAILQIFREPLKPGSEAAYKTVEDDTARLCVELKCPHPHLAMEPVTGPREVWWLNVFESEADKQRIETAYAGNRALMAALGRNSERKAALTGTAANVYARYRADLSRSSPWTLTGARFVVVAVTRQEDVVDGSVFDAPEGARYIVSPVVTRQQAEAEAARLGRGARIFAVLPHWGLPAKEWIAADPDFWKSNPVSRK